jgi:hypothetical protein
LWATFLLGIFLGGILDRIMTVIAPLVIIIHMFAAKLNYPVNLQDFIEGLFPLLTIDIFPTAYIYDKIFEFSNLEDAPLSD